MRGPIHRPLHRPPPPRPAPGGPAGSGGPRRGLVLVMTLWLVIVISLVAYSLAYEMRMEMELTTMRRDGLIAYELARIGLARGIADLKNDLILDYNPDEKNPEGQPFDGLGDIWRFDEDRLNVEVGQYGRYGVDITDEEAKLNINVPTPMKKDLMQYLLILLGERERQAEETAIAIVDWMDPDDKPGFGDGESEVIYYSEQIARENGIRWDEKELPLIRPKNDFFVSLEELLLVPGVTPELFYGYDPSDPEEVEERERRLAEGREVPAGLRDCTTLYSGGEINLNTVDWIPAAALFSSIFKDVSKGEGMADDLMKYLGADRRNDPDNDKAFRSIEEVARAMGGNAQVVVSKAPQVHPVGVRSHVFRIEASGTLLDDRGDIKLVRKLELLVGRGYASFPLHEEDEDDFGERRERRNDVRDFWKEIDRRRKREIKKVGEFRVPSVRAIYWSEF